jgi:Family of unknown function (DUF6263)
MTVRSAALLAVLLAAVPAAPAAAQQAVLLRYAPPVGQVTHYRSVTQTWMQIPGMPSDTSRPTMTRTMYQTRTVTAVDAGARVVTTVTDSSVQDLGPMAGMLPAGDMFKGMTMTQHVDPLGVVRSFDVTAPPGADPRFTQAMRTRAAERAFAFPAQAVHPGETWTSADTMDAGPEGGNRAILTFTYKLERVDRQGGSRLATISISGAVSANAGAPGAMEGRMSGTLVLDLTSGRITHSTSAMTAQVQSPDGGTMPMRTVSTTDVLP